MEERMQVAEIARKNFDRHIRQNPYPGRGLVVGRESADDAWLIVYWIMGRSENSRNRRFVTEGSTLRTEPVDASRVKDPSLIIYEAMLELPAVYLASNGLQTRDLHDALRSGATFEGTLARWEREPDPPNYTPRISAMLDLREPPGAIALSLLKANAANPELTDYYTIRPAAPPPGLGYCITTYAGDGDPLPPFTGDPLLMPCIGSVSEVLVLYWDALNAENRVALAVKRIPAGGGLGVIAVRNRFGDAE
jgi:hypothetical protein